MEKGGISHENRSVRRIYRNPGDLSWEGLERLGELTVYDRTPADKIAERIGDAEAVYTNKTPISAQTIGQCPNLKFIGVLATGYNVIDTAAAKAAGVIVSNIPTYGTDAVAQYAIAFCWSCATTSGSILTV